MLKQQAMDWEQIKKDTPKAFEKLIKWLDCSVEVEIEGEDLVSYTKALPTHHILNKEIMPLRRLYDFFDEQGIFICILPAFSGWDWEVYVDDKWIDSSDIKNENRKEAEADAFERAFFILEKQTIDHLLRTNDNKGLTKY